MSGRTRVVLPPGTPASIEVYVNGVLQREHVDYTRAGEALWFERSLKREGRLGPLRWLSIALGIAGTYRQNDSVDVIYEAGGRRVVVTSLPIVEEDQLSGSAGSAS